MTVRYDQYHLDREYRERCKRYADKNRLVSSIRREKMRLNIWERLMLILARKIQSWHDKQYNDHEPDILERSPYDVRGRQRAKAH